MKIFCALLWTATVAVTVERCWAEFLLVEVDDAAGIGKLCCLIPIKLHFIFKYKDSPVLHNIAYLIYLPYSKAQDQTIPQEHMKLRSLVHRVLMNASIRQESLLKVRNLRNQNCLVSNFLFIEVCNLSYEIYLLQP